MQILRLMLLLLRKGRLRDVYHIFRSARLSYSQFGEDLVIFHELASKPGFYVDVGAFHPVYLSNTYLLHQNGWRGLNLDASERTIALFRKFRPGDTSLVAAVSDEEREIDFCVFGDVSGVNYITDAGSAADNAITHDAPRERRRMRTQTLRQLLDQHVPAGTRIDLLNVDVEGQDLRVLKSNDWTKYRPRMILVEDFQSEADSEVVAYCRGLGYQLVATCHLTRIFRLPTP